jgi:hypothetical protein
MRAFQYQTTNKARALALVAQLRAAGYSHRKPQFNGGKLLPDLTFTTSTYYTCGPKPVYAMTWAYGNRAPLPPRRKLGRSPCSECGTRKVHSKKLCARCYERHRYWSDPEYRKRMNEKSRKKAAELYQRPEWREKRRAYGAAWAKAKRAKARERREAA